MSTHTNTMVAVDSLVANEFQVEIGGEVIRGVFRITGLTTFKLVEGQRVHEPFQLIKMVQRDANNTFNKWLRETIDAGDSADRPRRDLTIVAIDDGVETRRWAIKGAWISAVSYSDFDTGSSAMMEEVVTLHYEGIEETWPATATLE